MTISDFYRMIKWMNPSLGKKIADMTLYKGVCEVCDEYDIERPELIAEREASLDIISSKILDREV